MRVGVMGGEGRDDGGYPITLPSSIAINMSLTVGKSHFGDCALE